MGIAPPGPAQEPTVATQRDGRDPPRVSKDDRPGDGSPESPDSWGILTTHATQLGALGVGLFLLMKTYSVSHYSLTTASALLTAAPVGVILGTLTSYEYMLWPLMSVAAGLLAARLWNREGLSVACLGAGGLSAASALLSLPLYLAIGGVAVVAACVAQAALARAVGRDEAGAPPAWLPSRYTAVRSLFVAVIIVLLTVSLPNAWLPAEIVVFHGANGERRVVVGHVVGTGDGWMTVLRGGALVRRPGGPQVVPELGHHEPPRRAARGDGGQLAAGRLRRGRATSPAAGRRVSRVRQPASRIVHALDGVTAPRYGAAAGNDPSTRQAGASEPSSGRQPTFGES
jgi:hypothetical protein